MFLDSSGLRRFPISHSACIETRAERHTPFGITLVKAGFLRGGGSAPPPWPVRTPWVHRPLPPRSPDLGGPELAAGLLLRGAFAPLGPLWWFWVVERPLRLHERTARCELPAREQTPCATPEGFRYKQRRQGWRLWFRLRVCALQEKKKNRGGRNKTAFTEETYRFSAS